MNVKHLIATVAVLAATGSAFAQTGDYIPPGPFVSTKTRAEVIAELQQARAAGLLAVSDYGYPVVQATGTPKTRDEVRGELAEDLRTYVNGIADSLYVGG